TPAEPTCDAWPHAFVPASRPGLWDMHADGGSFQDDGLGGEAVRAGAEAADDSCRPQAMGRREEPGSCQGSTSIWWTRAEPARVPSHLLELRPTAATQQRDRLFYDAACRIAAHTSVVRNACLAEAQHAGARFFEHTAPTWYWRVLSRTLLLSLLAAVLD